MGKKYPAPEGEQKVLLDEFQRDQEYYGDLVSEFCDSIMTNQDDENLNKIRAKIISLLEKWKYIDAKGVE